MRTRRRQRNQARVPAPEPEPRERLLPGHEDDQRDAENDAAWWEDPSYGDRVAEKEWAKLIAEYEKDRAGS